jgi:hypothetical protein
MAGYNTENYPDRPDAATVAQFHTHADTDTGSDSLHHTLGPGVNQAASGAHTHDGNNSPKLIPGTAITGTKNTLAWASSVNAILVSLGAVDNST